MDIGTDTDIDVTTGIDVEKYVDNGYRYRYRYTAL